VEIDFPESGGASAGHIQDERTRRADARFMNPESLAATQRSGEAVFFQPLAKQALKKGESAPRLTSLRDPRGLRRGCVLVRVKASAGVCMKVTGVVLPKVEPEGGAKSFASARSRPKRFMDSEKTR